MCFRRLRTKANTRADGQYQISRSQSTARSGLSVSGYHAFNFGTALLQAGQPAQATEHHVTALEFKPDLEEVRSNLATALLSLNRFSEAATQLRRVLQTPTPSTFSDLHLRNTGTLKKPLNIMQSQ
jgi:Tfp pilus assembly protein PilF